MCGELRAVVSRYRLDVLSEGVEQPDDGFCQRLRLSAVGQRLHEDETAEAVYQHQDRMRAIVDDEIHLEIPETPAVGLRGPFVYAGPVRDARVFGGFALARRLPLEAGMAAMFAQFARHVRVDDVVDALDAYADALPCQYSAYLFWRPVLVEDHLFYAPHQHRVETAVGRGAYAAAHRPVVRLPRQIMSLVGGVALQLARKR